MGIYAEQSKEGAGYCLFFQLHINSSVLPFALLWQEIHKLHFPDSLQLDFCLVLPLRGTTGILEGEKGDTIFLRHSGSVTNNGSDSRSDSRCSGSCGWLVQDNQFLIRHMVQEQQPQWHSDCGLRVILFSFLLPPALGMLAASSVPILQTHLPFICCSSCLNTFVTNSLY